jgi:hypothetical protein
VPIGSGCALLMLMTKPIGREGDLPQRPWLRSWRDYFPNGPMCTHSIHLGMPVIRPARASPHSLVAVKSRARLRILT